MESPSLQTKSLPLPPALPTAGRHGEDPAGCRGSGSEPLEALVVDPGANQTAAPAPKQAPLLAAAQIQFLAEFFQVPDSPRLTGECAGYAAVISPLLTGENPSGGLPGQIHRAASSVGAVLGPSGGEPAASIGFLAALAAGGQLPCAADELPEHWKTAAAALGLGPGQAAALRDMLAGLKAVAKWAERNGSSGGPVGVPAALARTSGCFSVLAGTLDQAATELSTTDPAAGRSLREGAGGCLSAALKLEDLAVLHPEINGTVAGPANCSEAASLLVDEASQHAVSNELSVYQSLLNAEWKQMQANLERLFLTKVQFSTPAETSASLQGLAENLDPVLLQAQEIIGPAQQVFVDVSLSAAIADPVSPGAAGLRQRLDSLAQQIGALREELRSLAGHSSERAFENPAATVASLRAILSRTADESARLESEVANILASARELVEKIKSDIHNIIHPPPDNAPPSPSPRINTIGMALEQISSVTSSLTASLNSRAWEEQFVSVLLQQAALSKARREWADAVPDTRPVAAGVEAGRQTMDQASRTIESVMAGHPSSEILRTAAAQLGSVQANVQALSAIAQMEPASANITAATLSGDPLAVRFNRLVSDVVFEAGVPPTADVNGANADLAARARLLDEGLFHLQKVFANAETERARQLDSVRRYAPV